MRVRVGLLGVVCAWALGCGNSPSKRNSAEDDRRPPSEDRIPDRPLDITLRFHALGMPTKITSTADFDVDRKALALALDAARPPLVACFTGRPLSKENVESPAATWITMKVSEVGAVSGVQAVRSDAPDASTECAAGVLGKLAYSGQQRPFALSVWLDVAPKEAAGTAPTARTEPAPEPPGSGGPTKATPWRDPPSGMCAPDNVLAYLEICDRARPGGMWSDPPDDAFGAGGLGLSGVGGPAEIGSSGGIGLGVHPVGPGRRKPPQVRMAGASVTGRLPPEVIQRIVRRNFGRFRLCYENGLRLDPTLEGRVSVSFTIETDGSVSTVSHTTTMSDPGTAQCVERGFVGLSFPQPESGVVKVTYNIGFSPAEGAESKQKVQSVLGLDPAELTGATLAKAVTRDQALATSVDGDPAADVPFVLFVDRAGEHFAVIRTPRGTAPPIGEGLYGEAFNVFVVPAGIAKSSTKLIE